MISRIQKIIQLKKLNSSAFADQVGVPRSTISHILSGRNNPSLEFVQKVLDTFPEIRTSWLVRGEGHMLKATNTLFPEEDFAELTSEVLLQKSQVDAETGISKETRKEEDIVESKPSQEKEIRSPEAVKTEISQTGEGKKLTEKAEIPAERTEGLHQLAEKFDSIHKKTVRVLMFYSDGSFSEHFPLE
ncbi:MAG: helix-turn-helix domain-containing protein [Bacteroidales bacterium]|nr:helix-turn-helix domain-containing protein [Bacteroidales bacterium]